MRYLLFFLLFFIFADAYGQVFPWEVEAKRYFSRTSELSWGESALHRSSSNHPVDAQYYALDFEFRLTPDFIQIAKIDEYFRSLQDSVTEFSIDFASFQQGNLPWDSLRVSGDVASFTHLNDKLTVYLIRPFYKDEIIHVRIEFQGKPDVGGFLGFNYDPDFNGHPMISTLSEPYYAHYWWPCIDDPADKVDSATIKVTVPKNFKVASNGSLDSLLDVGLNRWKWIWKERYPIAPYLISLAISEYAKIEDQWVQDSVSMPLIHFVYPEDSLLAISSFAPIKDMLTAFSQTFGLYPFYKEKYGHAYFNWGGGMEHQTITSIGRVSPDWEYIYAHELGHQWFGDLITCENWHEIWMNEGFASYTEAVWEEWAYGQEAYFNYFRNTLSSISNWGTRRIYVDNLNNVWDIFHRTVYTKGMWILHMLRYELGDSLFFKVLQEYTKAAQFKFGVTSTQKFNQFVNGITGQNMNYFFNQWIYYEGYPVMEWDYEQRNDSLYFMFVQKQKNQFQQWTFYQLRLPFQLVHQSKSQFIELLIQPQETTLVTIPFKENIDAIYPNEPLWILTQLSYNDSLLRYENLPSEEGSTAFKITSFYPNPSRANTYLHLQVLQSGQLSFRIFNIAGQLIESRSIRFDESNQTFEFNLAGLFHKYSSLPSGIYFIKVEMLNQKKILKFVKLN